VRLWNAKDGKLLLRIDAGSAVIAAALSADATRAATAGADKKGDKPDLPPFPADASVRQTTRVGGRSLNYLATVGSLPVRDDKGKTIAQVVFTAYTLPGSRDPARPVTFAFNGGPGAASVYLNLGAIGPKRVPFGAAGDSLSVPDEVVAYLSVEWPSAAAWVSGQVGGDKTRVAYIGCLSVAPGGRGGGIGAALVGHVHRELDAAGIQTTVLHYAALNPLSVPFWSRCGYRPLWTGWEVRPHTELR